MQRYMWINVLATIFFSSCYNTTSENNAIKKDSTAHYNTVTETQKEYYQQQIFPLYNSLLATHGFSGGIVIAKNGEIVFEDYKGFYNYATKTPVTQNTALHIASVSKTFTGITTLKLMEEGKIDINADVRQYLYSFPYAGITVKNLLSHRSGLPNYVHAMEDKTVQTVRRKNRRGKWITYTRVVASKPSTSSLVTNQGVLQFLIEKKPPVEAQPDKRFQYCNTNYALLALIIEKVTETDFPTYMKKNVFEPLGMKDTYVFSIKDTANYTPSYKYNFSAYPLEFLDCVYGDKNVYSTPRDLLQWDKALFAGSFIKPETLQLAYTPYSNERPGTHNYGLGFRLFVFPTQTIPYHNGWWHGNNAAFMRLVKDTATIIVLGNKYNSRIYKAKEFAAVFNDVHKTNSDSLTTEE